MAKSRRVVEVREEDPAPKGGVPRLWGYGFGWLAAVAGVTKQRAREAVARIRGEPPELADPGNPVEAVCWALERRGHGDLAARVRAAFAD